MTRMMKDSGVEWIGEIPENWSIQKYKNFASSKMGETILASDTVEEGIPVYSATQDEKVFGFVKTSNTLLHKNDIVIPARGNSIGCATIVKDDVATCTQTTICSRNIHNISTSYLYYCCWGLKEWWFNYDGSAIPQITVKQVNNNLLPVPIPLEQQKIAAFLDEKCGAIDEIIRKTEQSIEEYKKLKQSVITKTVTKGIHPNRPMQDSNIEWIGEIPTDWEIRKIFQIFTQVKNKNQGMIENNLLSLSYGKIKQKNIETSFGLLPESFETYNIIEKDDIVLRLTDLQNDHRSLRVGLCKERGIITSAYVTMRLKDKQYAPYLYYLLHTFDIKKGFYGMGDGVRQGLNWDELKHLSLVLPPLNEQKEIADYLDEKCAEIDTLIEKKKQFLTEMANYKKSLIYEYVTGKKEVA